MNEQQMEILERHFPRGGVIVFRQANGNWNVASFGDSAPEKRVANRVVDMLTGHAPPTDLCAILDEEMHA